MLGFLNRIVKACGEHAVPMGVCGEIGGRTLEAMALLGLGVRRLSITPASVGPVRAMIRSLQVQPLQAELTAMLQAGRVDIRDALTQWTGNNSSEEHTSEHQTQM